MGKSQNENTQELGDDLLYIPTNDTGKLDIPMTGWDIRRVCAGGYNAAVDYAREKHVAEWLNQYSDELIFEEALDYSCHSEEELKQEDRTEWLGYIIFSYAHGMKEREDKQDFLATKEFQQEWANVRQMSGRIFG